VSTKGWDILHQGAKADIIGDYDFRNRVYSPTLGRPLQSDQLQFEAGEVNFYRWEGNVPNGHLDPSGNRWTFGDVALGAGTAFVIAGGAVLVVGTGGLAAPLVVGGAAAVIGGGLAGHYAESSVDAVNIGGATGLGVGSIGAGGVLVARFGVEQAGRIVLGAVGSSLTGTNLDFTKPVVPPVGMLPVGVPTRIIVNDEGIRKAMIGAPLNSQQGGGISRPMVERYVTMLELGGVPPPIKVDGNMIVDGNHRYVAGRVFGVEPPIQSWPGGRPQRAIPWDEIPISPIDWSN
jgi:RHS repeat-associated protein